MIVKSFFFTYFWFQNFLWEDSLDIALSHMHHHTHIVTCIITQALSHMHCHTCIVTHALSHMHCHMHYHTLIHKKFCSIKVLIKGGMVCLISLKCVWNVARKQDRIKNNVDNQDGLLFVTFHKTFHCFFKCTLVHSNWYYFKSPLDVSSHPV